MVMEKYLNENFGEVKAKHSSEEVLQKWRNLCFLVKNPKRRFRFTANLSKRYEAAAMRRTNQEKLRIAVLVSNAAFQFTLLEAAGQPSDYKGPEFVLFTRTNKISNYFKALYANVFTMSKCTRDRRPSEDVPIVFDKHDEGVMQPHDNALVVTMLVNNLVTKKILIDNGSSADILFWDTFIDMRIGRDKLRPTSTFLTGFAGEVIQPEGVITLPVKAGNAPKTSMVMVDFLVVKIHFLYKIILGRPALNRLKAVTSTYHLKVKFPTPNGIGEVRGEQSVAYSRELKPLVQMMIGVTVEGLMHNGRADELLPPPPPTRWDEDFRDEQTIKQAKHLKKYYV